MKSIDENQEKAKPGKRDDDDDEHLHLQNYKTDL